MTLVATWPSSPLDLLNFLNPSGSFGKMSPASLHLEGNEEQGQTLRPSSQRWGTSGMGGHTASLTLNTSGWHSEDAESGYAATATLSQVLETGDLPPQYFLTARACAGILRRASARGKPLPEMLRRALEKKVAEDVSGTEDK